MAIQQNNKGSRANGLALAVYSVFVALMVLILRTAIPLTDSKSGASPFMLSQVSGTPVATCISTEPTMGGLDIVGLIANGDERTENGPWCFPLMLEDKTTVGEVIVKLGDMLTVLFTITEEGWCLTDTQVHVGLNNTPVAYNDFRYQHNNLNCITRDVFNVAGTTGDDLYVGIHAGVHQDAQIIMDVLTTYRDRVTINLAHPGGDSFFNTTVRTYQKDTFDGFSIDTARVIYTGPTYNANLISSYDPYFPDGLVAYKENLDLVNYIINQNYTDNGYTYGDVQWAIWILMGPHPSSRGLGIWSHARVSQIVEDARIYGEGFLPDCAGGVVAMVLQPVRRDGETSAGVTIIEVPLTDLGACTEPQTPGNGAWAVFGEDPITQIADTTCE